MVKGSSIARFLPGLVVLGALFATVTYWPALAVSGYQLDQERGVFSLAPVLQEATPAVVNVSVKTTQRTAMNPMLQDPFFRQFFDRRQLPQQRERKAVSAGSGVIIDAKNGYVLTNHHVIERADEVMVTLADQREFDAEIVGSDPGTDVALLKIDATDIAELPIGDSDDLLVGDLVIAIGNPFGIGQTVTSGIVSALGRQTGIVRDGYEDFIQTDASINPGNSGGALINSKGELVGLNTAIITGGGGNGSVGIGFAVPSNIASAIKAQLVKFGEVRRGQIGVHIQDMKPDIAVALDLKGQSGAIISEVIEDSPAAKAGLKAGDVIVSVDGKRIDGSSDLRNRIGLTEKGKTVTLAYYRDSERKTVKLQVGEVSDSVLSSEDAIPRLMGASFSAIPDDHPRREVKGVYVSDVEPGSPAWNYGLRDGDIIIEANRQRVTSVNELEAAAKNKGRVLALKFLRGNSQVFLAR